MVQLGSWVLASGGLWINEGSGFPSLGFEQSLARCIGGGVLLGAYHALEKSRWVLALLAIGVPGPSPVKSLFFQAELCFVVLYCNFRSLPFLGLLGFFLRQLKV